MPANIIIFYKNNSLAAKNVTFQKVKTRKRSNAKLGYKIGDIIYSRRLKEILSNQLTGLPYDASWKYVKGQRKGEKDYIVLDCFAPQIEVLLKAKFNPQDFDWTMRNLKDNVKKSIEATRRPMAFINSNDEIMLIYFYPSYTVCPKCQKHISWPRYKDHICNDTRLSYITMQTSKRQGGIREWDISTMLNHEQRRFKVPKKNGKNMKPRIFCFDLEWHSELKLIYLMCVSEYSAANDPEYKHVRDHIFTITYDDICDIENHQPETIDHPFIRIEWLRRVVVAKFAKWLSNLTAASSEDEEMAAASPTKHFDFYNEEDYESSYTESDNNNDDDDDGDESKPSHYVNFFISFNGSRSDVILMFKTLMNNLSDMKEIHMARSAGRIVSLEMKVKNDLILFRDIILYIPAEYKGPLDVVCKSLALEQQKIVLNFDTNTGDIIYDEHLEEKISKMSAQEKREYKHGQMLIVDRLMEDAMLQNGKCNPLSDQWHKWWNVALKKSLIPYCLTDAQCCIGIFSWFAKFYTTLSEIAQVFPPGEQWKILFNLTSAQAAFFSFPRFLDPNVVRNIWVPQEYLESIQRSTIYGGKVCSAIYGQKVELDIHENFKSDDYEILWVDIRSMYPSSGNAPTPIGKCMSTNAEYIQSIIDDDDFFHKGPTIAKFPPFIARVHVRRSKQWNNDYYEATYHNEHNTIHNIKTIMPPFPFREGSSNLSTGKLRWIYNGEWQGVYNCADIYLMKREFCEIKVIDDENCLYWPDGWSRETIAKFFSTMYTMKEEATKSGNKLIQTASKLCMNSVYGKLLQRCGQKEKVIQESNNSNDAYIEEEEYLGDDAYCGDDDAIPNGYIAGYDGDDDGVEDISVKTKPNQYGLPTEKYKMRMYESSSTKNAKPIIYGSFVLSYSRIMFNQMCNAAIYNCHEPGDLEQIYPGKYIPRHWGLYCDTDSIMFVRDKKWPIDAIENMYGTSIGRWEDDKPWFKFHLAKEVLGKNCKNIKIMGVMGRKFYILGCDCVDQQHFKIKSKGHAKEEIDPKDLLNAMFHWNPFLFNNDESIPLEPSYDGGKKIGITSETIAKKLSKHQTSRTSFKVSLVKKMAFSANIKPIFELENTTLIRRIRMYVNEHVSKCSLCEQFFYHPHFDENILNLKNV
jgi:hypothetical protein